MEMNEQKHPQAAILDLQHLLAVYAGSILVSIMIAGALSYSVEQLTYLISMDIFMCGVATFLQLQLCKYSGVELPVVLDCAFQSAAPLSIIGTRQGSGYMLGVLIVSGVYAILISGISLKIADFLPPVVTRSVIATIGLALIPVAIGNMGDNADPPTAQSVILVLITIAIVPVVNIFAKGSIESIAILIGLVGGTIAAAFMGLVDTSVVTEAPLIHIPQPFYFGAPKFEITSTVMMCIITTVSMIESTGVYLTLPDLIGERLDSKRLRSGYRAEGVTALPGGILNTFPYTGFSQNVGLVRISGVRICHPIYYTALSLVTLGFPPKFGAMVQMIPSPALGGVMIVLFGMAAFQGMQMLDQVDLQHNEHNLIIAAVSIACGIDFDGTNLSDSLPSTLQMFLTNGIVIATLFAVVLNLVLNGKTKTEEIK